jgi:hypothetical protein
METTKTTRDSVWVTGHNPSKPNESIELCKWINGMGFDVHYDARKVASFTFDEWDAIQVAMQTLDPDEVDYKALCIEMRTDINDLKRIANAHLEDVVRANREELRVRTGNQALMDELEGAYKTINTYRNASLWEIIKAKYFSK